MCLSVVDKAMEFHPFFYFKVIEIYQRNIMHGVYERRSFDITLQSDTDINAHLIHIYRRVRVTVDMIIVLILSYQILLTVNPHQVCTLQLSRSICV